MKNIVILLICNISQLFSQGKVFEGKAVSSKILAKNVNYSIYLPPNYEANVGRKYPVLFLLHGYSDNETAWVQFGNVDQIADKAIANGDITPMIIVMPNGGLDWYVNDYSGKVRWMDMFIQEFIPAIDKEYRTRPSRDFRAISGLSMGGYGAFMMSIKNPSVFGYCAGLSAAIWTSERALIERKDALKQPFWPPTSTDKEEIRKYYKNYDVLQLVKTIPADSLQKVKWYFDCGNKDFLTDGNAMLHIALNAQNIEHEYYVANGYHNWLYWRTHILDALKFVTKGFDRRD